MKEPQMFPDSSPDTYDIDRLFPRPGFNRALKTETSSRFGGPVDDRGISVVDPEDALAVTSLRVENPSKETFGPVRSRIRRPVDDLSNSSYSRPIVVGDGS